MLEPSLYRQRHTVLDVSCQVRLSSCSCYGGFPTANPYLFEITLQYADEKTDSNLWGVYVVSSWKEIMSVQ